MNTTTADAATTPEALREAMIAHIKQAGHARTPAVETALRTVERHRYVPNTDPAGAYANHAVITKQAPDGSTLSCASVPTVVAMMLDQLDIQPGHRILEIGAGTGYNAALLAELTGPTGAVTTVDIDPDVTAGARQALDATGYHHITVDTRDGALGAPDHAPYDRIIITVGAWDIPTAWYHQLAPAGRLVVPLSWRGQTRSVAFTHGTGYLHSDTIELCGFIPMIGQDGQRSGHINHDPLVTLHWDIDQPINTATLTGVLDQPKTTSWTGTTIGSNESFDGIWLRMTATDPATCRIQAHPDAVTSGLCTPVIPIRTPALADNNSLAYLAVRKPDPTQPRWELGAISHGPHRQHLANRLRDHIHAWAPNRNTRPTIHAYPTTTTNPNPANGQLINKQHTTLSLTP